LSVVDAVCSVEAASIRGGKIRAGVPEAILRRQIAHFAKADPAYGAGVDERVGLAEEVPAE
jgi:catalase